MAPLGAYVLGRGMNSSHFSDWSSTNHKGNQITRTSDGLVISTTTAFFILCRLKPPARAKLLYWMVLTNGS